MEGIVKVAQLPHGYILGDFVPIAAQAVAATAMPLLCIENLL